MKSVDSKPDPRAWTAGIVLRDGGLPDFSRLASTLLRAGNQFSLRGVEVVVDGRLIIRDGQPALRIEGTDRVLLLAPLTRKVQWDVRTRKDQPLTDEERRAFARLTDPAQDVSRPVRVTGPLQEGGATLLPTLQVRAFDWSPGTTAAPEMTPAEPVAGPK